MKIKISSMQYRIVIVVLSILILLKADAQEKVKRKIISRYQPFDTSSSVINFLKGQSGQFYQVALVASKTEIAEIPDNEIFDDAAIAEVRTCTEVQKPFYCKSENFAGCARRNVKTSYSDKPAKSYTLASLLAKLEENDYQDEVMKQKIKVFAGKQNNRLKEEDQAVTIKNVFLFAIKRLNDNDYHMIVCDKQKKLFITVELSGLPDNADPDSPLVKARKNFNKNFKYNVPCNSDYLVFTDIIYPIKFITGTLFFDVNHDGGSIGPRNFDGPKTAWEIHPVTRIKFGDPIDYY